MLPDDLRYTEEHEWVRSTGGSGNRVQIGITDHAQGALGDIVYVTLPAVGAQVTAGEPLGEVESTKSVNDIYAPVTGTVVARNDSLDAAPELLNTDPYGEGWLVEIEAGEPADAALEKLLDAQGYARLTGGG